MNPSAIIAFLACALAAAPAQALQCKAASGMDRHALIELYTSEGCSSCPPAERWLSRFRSGATDSRVVPVEFHVDYWDHGGWKDPFSDARYTRRQRQFQKATGARFVYTPQVVVSGHDVPDWRSGVTVPFNERIGRVSAKAKIAIDATVADDASIHGAVDAAIAEGTPAKNLTLVVLALQDGLASRVTAGENRGEELTHDFVARDMASTALTQASGHLAFAFKPGARWAAGRMSVAAFVQDAKTGEVLQAIATGACR
jgi:hypothetical protein